MVGLRQRPIHQSHVAGHFQEDDVVDVLIVDLVFVVAKPVAVDQHQQARRIVDHGQIKPAQNTIIKPLGPLIDHTVLSRLGGWH